MRSVSWIFAFCAVIAMAQSPASAQIPRQANGKPDLTGVWQGGSNRPGSWADANTGLGVGGTGTDPAAAESAPSSPATTALPPPYQPWAAEKVLESFNMRGVDDPTVFCLPTGVPRNTLISLFPLQIIQTPEQVVILHEYMHVFRVIPLNTEHPENLEPTYTGDSVGHWDGDTLVVDVISFNDKTWLFQTGTLHSDALHITERYTRVSKDRIDYEVTMEDPNVFTEPWVIHSSLMLREGTRLREYVCAENNLDPARYEELLKNGANISR